MKDGNLSRERVLWTAVAAVLATSASWLAAIGFLLLVSRTGIEAQEAWAAGRALVRIGWFLVREAAPAALLALLMTGVIVVYAWARRAGEPGEGRERHA